MAYCVFTNCLSVLGSGITPYTSLDSRSGVSLTSNGQMLFVGSSDNSGPLGMVFQHINSFGVCRADITSTRYGISGNDLSINVDSSDPDTAGGLYIKYRGNVGIGTSSPSTKLNIRNRVDRAYTPNSFNDTLHALHIEFCNQNQRAGLIRFTSHGNLENSFGVVQVGCAASGCGQGDFVFQAYKEAGGSGYNELMRLTNEGRVGIGTASPSSKLDVSGADGRIQSRVDSSDGSTINVRPNAGKCGWISYTEDAVADRWGIGIKNGDAKLYFSSGNVGSGGGTTRMVLDGSGNIGIGITSPIDKLEVAGGIHTSGTAAFSKACTGYLDYHVGQVRLGITGANTTTPAVFRIDQYSSNASINRTPFYIDTCGSIGVNTSTPGTYKLNVNGAFYAAGSSKEYKTSICEYNTDSCMFMKLKPVTYEYKEEWKHLGKELKSGTQIGLIAEDTAEVFPELAVLKEEENEEKVVRNVDYEKLTIVLLSEVQKLRKELDDLKTK